MTVSQLQRSKKNDFRSYFCMPAQISLLNKLTVGQFYSLDRADFSGYNNYDVTIKRKE